MISSTSNPVIRRVRRLRKRAHRERGKRFLVEGHRAVRAALEAGAQLHELLYTRNASRLRAGLLEQARVAGVTVHHVSAGVMEHLTSVTTAPDVLAVASVPAQRSPLAFDGVLLVDVRDPATAGSIMASAAATGAHSVIAGPGTVDLFDPKTVRAANGAHFLLAISHEDDVDGLLARARAGGSHIVSLRQKAFGHPEPQVSGPFLLVIGTNVLADSEYSVPFDMVEPSLAVRAGVALYALRRDR